MNISVGIGRNVGNRPMNDERWAWFKRDVRTQLDLAGAEVEAVEEGFNRAKFYEACNTGQHIRKGLK